GSLPGEKVILLLLDIIRVLAHKEVPAVLRGGCAKRDDAGPDVVRLVVSCFQEEDRVAGFGEVGGKRGAAGSAPDYDVVVDIILLATAAAAARESEDGVREKREPHGKTVADASRHGRL